MSELLSSSFGAVRYEPGDLFVFSEGLPGFPEEKALLPIQVPEQFPLVYLQSLRTSDLCFVALPVRSVASDYQLTADPEDLARLGIASHAQPGSDMLCLALVCFEESGRVTVNLRAPIVVNPASRQGMQVICPDERYPTRFPLKDEREAVLC